MHSFNKLASDGESQATAPDSTMHISFQAHKAFKDGLLFVRRHSETPINHFDPHFALLWLFNGGDENRCLRRRVAQGIGNKVAENLLQTYLVRPHLDRRRNMNLDLALLLVCVASFYFRKHA